MGVSRNGGIPQELDGFKRENPIQMDDLGGTPICGNLQMNIMNWIEEDQW